MHSPYFWVIEVSVPWHIKEEGGDTSIAYMLYISRGVVDKKVYTKLLAQFSFVWSLYLSVIEEMRFQKNRPKVSIGKTIEIYRLIIIPYNIWTLFFILSYRNTVSTVNQEVYN